jgi:hypothetical protein
MQLTLFRICQALAIAPFIKRRNYALPTISTQPPKPRNYHDTRPTKTSIYSIGIRIASRMGQHLEIGPKLSSRQMLLLLLYLLRPASLSLMALGYIVLFGYARVRNIASLV